MLQTTSNGTALGTNWYGALNTSTMGRSYVVIFAPNLTYSNWVTRLTDLSITSIYYGRGVVYNVHMYPSANNYLDGYLYGDNLQHYVAGCGYNAYNPSSRLLAYVDPISADYRPSAHGTHTVSAHVVGRATHPMGAVL